MLIIFGGVLLVHLWSESNRRATALVPAADKSAQIEDRVQ